MSGNHQDLASQGMSHIAGALVRKVLTKTGNCEECKDALTTTEYLPDHLHLTFRDGHQELSRASEAVCQVVTVIKNLGQSLFPALFLEEGVLEKFRSRSRQETNLDALCLCEVHGDAVKEIIINYVCNVSFFDEIKRFNVTLKHYVYGGAPNLG